MSGGAEAASTPSLGSAKRFLQFILQPPQGSPRSQRLRPADRDATPSAPSRGGRLAVPATTRPIRSGKGGDDRAKKLVDRPRRIEHFRDIWFENHSHALRPHLGRKTIGS